MLDNCGRLLAVAIFIAIANVIDANSQRKDAKGDEKSKSAKIESSKKMFNLSAVQHTAISGILVNPDVRPPQYVPKTRITDEQRLMDKLFDNYDRFSRPVVNLNDAVTISMSLTITQIFELDEKNQVLITNAWANLEWVDQYMVWDPEEFAGLQMVRIVSSRLWLPDIVLYNNAADFSPNVLETRAMVSNNGLVFWSVPTKLFSSCKIDVTYFPFDEQKCRMKFGSWTYDGFKLDLVNSSTTADLSLYMKSGEWDLISAEQKRNVVIYTCCIEPYPDITFYLHIQRKPLYYAINVFLPCLIMSALTLLVFLLPAESGEKCGLGITIMLSFAVFMLTVIEKLPDTSESFPLISVYLTVVMSSTAISIVITVALLNLNHKSSQRSPVRPWLKSVLDAMSPFCCITIHSPTIYPDESNSDSCTCNENVDLTDGMESQLYKNVAPKTFWDNSEWKPKSPSFNEKLYSFPQFSRRRRQGSNGGDFATPSEMLRKLTDQLTETANDSLKAGNHLGETYHQVATGLQRLLERERQEAEEEEMTATWRRLAQLIDRVLFWLILCIVTFFTVFLLILAPSMKLL